MLKYMIIALIAALGHYAQAAVLKYQVSGVSSSEGNKLTKGYQYCSYLFFTKVNGVSTDGKERNIGKTTTLERVKDELAKASEGNITQYAVYAQENNAYENGIAAFSFNGSKHDWNTNACVSGFVTIIDALTYKDARYYMIVKSNGNEIVNSVYNSTANTITLDFGSQAGNKWIRIKPKSYSGLIVVVR